MSTDTCTSYYNDTDYPCMHCAEAIRQEKENEVDREVKALVSRASDWGVPMKDEYVNNLRNILLARAGILDPSTPRYDEITAAATVEYAVTKKGIKS